jgi:hypothetical protein
VAVNIPNLFNGGSFLPQPPPGSINNLVSSYAAGKKTYGGGRSMPNIGNVGGEGLSGYNERDNAARAKKSAIQRRLGGQMTGDPNNANYNNYMAGGIRK